MYISTSFNFKCQSSKSKIISNIKFQMTKLSVLIFVIGIYFEICLPAGKAGILSFDIIL